MHRKKVQGAWARQWMHKTERASEAASVECVCMQTGHAGVTKRGDEVHMHSSGEATVGKGRGPPMGGDTVQAGLAAAHGASQTKPAKGKQGS